MNVSGPVKASTSVTTSLSASDFEAAKRAFAKFDKNDSGTIDTQELRAVMQTLGHNPSDEELFILISQVDEDRSGEIDFKEFLVVFEKQCASKVVTVDDNMTLEAFVALGGQADKGGQVSVDKLVQTLREFELQLNMDQLLRDSDKDMPSVIDYNGFRQLLA